MTNAISTATNLRERLVDIRRQIETIAEGCSRRPEQIQLIAIGKTYPAVILETALAAGVTDLGENRVQEAEEKIRVLGRNVVRWHLVGHLQANKARRAVKLFDFIHSLDSVSLAHRLDRLCTEEGRDELPVLIQVDLADEATKSGIEEAKLGTLVASVRECSRLRLVGLMTLPPFSEDVELVRPYFRRLRQLRDELSELGAFNDTEGELSMGMSHDFGVAIEEGATMLRIGTAIFGERNPA